MNLAALALALLLQGDTPEQTFEQVKKAATEKNFGALFDALAPSDRQELDKNWEQQKKAIAGNEELLQQFSQQLGVTPDELKKMTMKDAMLRMAPKAAEREPAAFDREFRKYKEGTIAEKKIDGDTCLLKVKVKDETVDVELAREGGKWYLSMAPERRASHERNASARLKSLATAQADFRANDRDGNKVSDFWVKDVAGLYGIETAGEAIKLIMLEIAQSDRTAGRGKYPSVQDSAEEAHYHFAALKKYRAGGKAVDYDTGAGRNLSRFGIVSYPARYPQSGRMTFIISEENTIFSKDTGGKPVEEFPDDPRKEGWKPLD